MRAIFWGSMGAVAYAYTGYPVLLGLVARRLSAPAREGSWSAVSVIVAAHNEEACIADKVRNVLDQDYPPERLEVVVVSDGSTDRTEEVVAGLAGPRVRLVVQRPRQGKNLALNLGVARATGDVVVFTDANAMLAPGALAKLVAPFADPRVGLVSGLGRYGRTGGSTTRVVSNAYARLEQFIKEREAAMGFLAGADGALYAMRRELYQELRADQVHDLVHPIHVALAGRRCAFAPEACTVEPPSTDAGAEFKRHVRIISQGFFVLVVQAPVLLAAGRVRELWMLLSHRLLRWTSAAFLLAALVANVTLLQAHPFYRISLALQVAFYALALGGAVGERLRLRPRLLALPYFFCVVSMAGAVGFVQYLRGRRHASWVPTGGRP